MITTSSGLAASTAFDESYTLQTVRKNHNLNSGKYDTQDCLSISLANFNKPHQ